MKTRYFIVFFTATNAHNCRIDIGGPNYVNRKKIIEGIKNRGLQNPQITNIIELSKEDYLEFINENV